MYLCLSLIHIFVCNLCVKLLCLSSIYLKLEKCISIGIVIIVLVEAKLFCVFLLQYALLQKLVDDDFLTKDERSVTKTCYLAGKFIHILASRFLSSTISPFI